MADTVQKLDSQGLSGRAKQLAQVDNISEALDAQIEKLSSLLHGLTVWQLALASNSEDLFVLILDVVFRPKQSSLHTSQLKLDCQICGRR